MISLGQIALLAIGTLDRRRGSATRTSLPFPVLLARHRARSRRRRRPDRPAGAAAERPLPRPDHADGGRRDERRPDDDRLPERRRRLLRATPTPSTCPALEPVGRPGIAGGDTAYYRYAWSSARCMFLLALLHFAPQARPRLGGDPPERAGGARRRREHHPLQALGVRAGVVHDRRRRRACSRRSVGAADARIGFPTQDSLTLLAAALIGGIYSSGAPSSPASSASSLPFVF